MHKGPIGKRQAPGPGGAADKRVRLSESPSIGEADMRALKEMMDGVSVEWWSTNRGRAEGLCHRVQGYMWNVKGVPFFPERESIGHVNAMSTFIPIIGLCLGDTEMGEPATKLYSTVKGMIPTLWATCTASCIQVAINFSPPFFTSNNKWSREVCRILPLPSLLVCLEEAIRVYNTKHCSGDVVFLMDTQRICDALYGNPVLWKVVFECLAYICKPKDFLLYIDEFWENQRGRQGLRAMQTESEWRTAIEDMIVEHSPRATAILQQIRTRKGAMIGVIDDMLDCIKRGASVFDYDAVSDLDSDPGDDSDAANEEGG